MAGAMIKFLTNFVFLMSPMPLKMRHANSDFTNLKYSALQISVISEPEVLNCDSSIFFPYQHSEVELPI